MMGKAKRAHHKWVVGPIYNSNIAEYMIDDMQGFIDSVVRGLIPEQATWMSSKPGEAAPALRTPLPAGRCWTVFPRLDASTWVEETLLLSRLLKRLSKNTTWAHTIYVGDNAYLRGLREICTEKGIMLIFDEVQTGFGRTGKIFAAEHSGVVPDILAMLRRLCASCFPLRQQIKM